MHDVLFLKKNKNYETIFLKLYLFFFNMGGSGSAKKTWVGSGFNLGGTRE